MKPAWMAIAALIVAGCGRAPEPPPNAADPAPSPDASESEPEPETETEMAMSDMDFRMYDREVTTDGSRRPTIWIHADQGALRSPSGAEQKVWAIEGARAVIYRDEAEQLVVEAGSGVYDEREQRARLEGGVKMQSDTFAIGLEHVVWDNAEGVARSNAPVTLTRGATSIEAKRLELDPDKETIVLTDVSGMIEFQHQEES